MDTRVTGSDVHQDAPNKHTTASDAHYDVTNAETIVSDIRSDVANTRTAASDVHRSKLKSHEGGDGQNEAVRTTRTLSPNKYLLLLRLTLGQRPRLQLSSPFNIPSSAPGQLLPPPPRNTHETTFNIRRDVVSEVHRDLVNTQAMVSDLHRNMLKSQEGASGQPQSVSVARNLSLTERTLTVAQTQNRSVISTVQRFRVLCLYVARLGNYHLHHQGSSLDAMS